VLAIRHDALLQTTEAIREGKIAAVKGLGGFHFMVDARNDVAVRHLRERNIGKKNLGDDVPFS